MFLYPSVDDVPASPPTKYTSGQLFGIASGVVAGVVVVTTCSVYGISALVQRRRKRAEAHEAQAAEDSLTRRIRHSPSLRSHVPSWREPRYAFELPRYVNQRDGATAAEIEMSVLPSYRSVMAQGQSVVGSAQSHRGSDEVSDAAQVDKEKTYERVTYPPPAYMSTPASGSARW